MVSLMKRFLIFIFSLAAIIFFGALFLDNGPQVSTKELKKTEENQTIGASFPYPSSITEQVTENRDGILVTRVVDGDTIEVETGQKVRYIGIDTPETSDPRKPVQCMGKEATAKNKALVEGKKVRLEKDVSETDKYGRLLRYIYVDDVFVNKILVQEGYALSSTYPPDVKYQALFADAEKIAKKAKKGLWGSCGFVAGTRTTAPASNCVIKGNISSSGDKIYHLPGQKYYSKTVISDSKGERWFCTEEEAQGAGWRKSKL